MVRDELQLETYKVDINKKYNKKIIIFLILLSIILIALVTVNIEKVIKKYNVFKGYEAQIISLKNQGEKRQEENSCCDRGCWGCSAGLRGAAGGKKDCRTERGLFCAGGDGGSGSERYAFSG